MATSTAGNVVRDVLAERGAVVGGALVLVAGLAVGAASLVDGATVGFGARFPIYLLAGSVVFVGALFTMRHSPRDGTTVLGRATLTAVLGFVVVGLGTEAVVYGLVVVAPELSVYALSAVTVTCGLAYWSLRNWDTVDDLTRPW